MTIKEISDRIADISCSIYEGATADDMKDALDALWNEINPIEEKNEESREDVHDELQRLCFAAPTDDEDEFRCYLEAMREGLNVKYVDESIDDGCDENEDGNTYVMKGVYDIQYKGYTFVLRLYFGNYTRTVGYFTLS